MKANTDYLMEINKISQRYVFPTNVLNDVLKRCTDWMSSGGKETDVYIFKQYLFLVRYKTAMKLERLPKRNKKVGVK